MTDTNTRLRFLTQMLANLEQLVQSSEEMNMHVASLKQYRTYVVQTIKEEYNNLEKDHDTKEK